MKAIKTSALYVLLIAILPLNVFAQAVTVPMGDGAEDLTVIPLPPPVPVAPPAPVAPVFIQDAIGKPIRFTRGFDTSIGGELRIDPTVQINLVRFEPVFGFPGIVYTPRPQIIHWGLQQFFTTSQAIYATGVLMIDRGDFAEGGRFEWTVNNFDRLSFHNIVRTDGFEAAWIRNWTDPVRGDTVHFFLMSDDERFTSNPITFTWP